MVLCKIKQERNDIYEPRCEKTGLRCFRPGPTQTSEDGWGLEISDLGSERLFYPCSENKGADQLRGYREADLRLCFRICGKPVFSRRGSYILVSKRNAYF